MLKFQPKTFYIGQNFVSLPSCQSTNDIAAEKIQNKDFYDGTVIVTDHQTAGRGQRGNSWESQPKENLLFSLIIKPKFLKISDQFFLSLISALAICDSLSQVGFLKINIKWPNDIFVNNKKLAGILIENNIMGQEIATSIIGIGINNFQTKFSNPRASSLKIENSTLTVDNYELLGIFCEHFEKRYEQLKSNEFELIKAEYLEKLMWFKQNKKFKDKNGVFNGSIVSLENNGQIIISTLQSTRCYDIKEIEFLFDD